MFLTSKSRIEQTSKNGYWKLIDNELYVFQNRLMITPRGFWTDGYTFPNFIIPFIGDKNKFDVRPAHAHDLMCRFHEKIIINLDISELINRGYLHEHEDKIVCEDIPKQFLTIEKISKKDCDDLLKEMMIDCGISKKTSNIIRFGVRFNLNWYWKTGKRSLTTYNLFKEEIKLINGF